MGASAAGRGVAGSASATTDLDAGVKTVVNGFCYNDGKSRGYIYDSVGHTESSCTEQCGARGDCVASQFLGGRCTLFKASGCTGSGITSDGRVQNLWCDRYFSPPRPSTPPPPSYLAPGTHCDRRPNHHPSCSKCKNGHYVRYMRAWDACFK